MMMIAARVATGRAVRPEGEGNQLLHMSSKLRCRCFWDRAEGPECLGMRKGARGKGPSLKKKIMFVFDSGGPGVYVGMFGCMYKHADRHVHLRDHRSIYIEK